MMMVIIMMMMMMIIIMMMMMMMVVVKVIIMCNKDGEGNTQRQERHKTFGWRNKQRKRYNDNENNSWLNSSNIATRQNHM